VAAFVFEVVATFLFLVTILGVTHPFTPAGFAGLAIGLTLVVIHLVGINIRVQAHLFHLRRNRRPEFEPLAGTRAAGFRLLEPRHLARRRFAMPITQKFDDGRHAHAA
jgi:hypothetical protein